MEKEIIKFEEIDLPIKVFNITMKKSGDYRGMHSHLAFEAVKVEKGRVNCFVNDEIITLNDNEIIFINSNTGHKLLSEDATVTYMQIDPSFFLRGINAEDLPNLFRFISHKNSKPYLLIKSINEASEILDKIIAKYNESEKASRLYLKAYMHELFAFLVSEEFLMPKFNPIKKFDKIKPIVEFIDRNFKSEITLDEICSLVAYNKYAMCHSFKAVTGGTIFDYINFLRIELALKKLKDKENSILEIALECGFSSPTYFNRVFKSVIGCSPSVYRKNLPEK